MVLMLILTLTNQGVGVRIISVVNHLASLLIVP